MQRIEAGLLYGALVYCNNCTGVASLKCFTAWCYQFALIKQAKPHGGEKLCKCVSLLHTCFLLGRTLKGRNVKQTTICGVSASLFLICMAYLHCDLVLRLGLWNLWNLLTTWLLTCIPPGKSNWISTKRLLEVWAVGEAIQLWPHTVNSKASVADLEELRQSQIPVHWCLRNMHRLLPSVHKHATILVINRKKAGWTRCTTGRTRTPWVKDWLRCFGYVGILRPFCRKSYISQPHRCWSFHMPFHLTQWDFLRHLDVIKLDCEASERNPTRKRRQTSCQFTRNGISNSERQAHSEAGKSQTVLWTDMQEWWFWEQFKRKSPWLRSRSTSKLCKCISNWTKLRTMRLPLLFVKILESCLLSLALLVQKTIDAWGTLVAPDVRLKSEV